MNDIRCETVHPYLVCKRVPWQGFDGHIPPSIALSYALFVYHYRSLTWSCMQKQNATAVLTAPPIINMSDDADGSDHAGELDPATAEEERTELAEPHWYNVVLFNDDFTPMDFVVDILEQFFGMDGEKAVQTMMTVHSQGKAVCGRYPYDIAATRAWMVNEYAREHEHPLLCDIERAD